MLKKLLVLLVALVPLVAYADSAYLDTNNRAFFVTKGTQKMTIGTGGAGTFEILASATPIAKVNTSGLAFESGKTVAIQEATAGSACSGTVTADGTTAVVVSTTCAKTGSRIIIARNAAPSGTAICWTDTIVDGVSFNLDCSAAETSTHNWFIVHEAP